VHRIAIGEQEHQRHGLHALGAQTPRGGAHRGLVERYQHVAPRGQPLRDFQAATARHERRGTPIQDVVHPEEVAAPDLEHVAEAIGGDEPGARALAFEQRVDADGRAVDHQSRVGKASAGLIDAAEHAVQERLGRAEGLGVEHGTGRLVQRDEIREGAADVDADAEGHGPAV
jgi:hypothetical protein